MFGLRRGLREVGADDAAAQVAAADAAAASAQGGRAQALLNRLEWTVIRRLDGLLQGDYRTLFRGFGLDLADLREYQPSDDVRYIDWNVTARMETPYVREFQEDREVAAWFLLDLSGSIDFGSTKVRKRELAAELVGVLARVLTRHGNRVGAVLYAGGVIRVIPARSGRRHVLHVLDQMLRNAQADAPEPAALRSFWRRSREAAIPDASRATDLRVLIEGAYPAIKRRSVLFVVSDFISEPGWGKGLAQLSRRHEVIAVRLYDPLEVSLPDLGLVVMQDAETGEQMFVDTRDKGFRKRFQQAADQREQLLRTSLGEAGVDCLELSTNEPLPAALLNFIKMRKQRSRLGGGASSAIDRRAIQRG